MADVVPEISIPSPDIDLNPDAPDVPRATLRTLAEWTAKLTSERQDRSPTGTDVDNRILNAYTIDPPNGDVSLDPMERRVEGKFSPTAYRDGLVEVPGLKKGDRRIGSPDFKTGHEYLNQAQRQGEVVDAGSSVKTGVLDDNVDRYTSAVLSTNRWSQTSVRSPDDPVTIGGKSYTWGQLSNVGDVITTRACSEMGSSNSDFNASSGAAEAAAILPGFTQMGLKRVDWSEFNALSALGDVVSGPQKEVVQPEGSWGQMNNPLDQYSGMSAMGMAALSIALFVSSTAVLAAFNSLLGVAMKVTGGKQSSPTKDVGGDRDFLGQHGPRRSAGLSGGFPPLPIDSNLVANLMGVRQGQYDWTESVEAGMLRFYGSDKTSLSDVVGGGLLGAIGNIGDMIGRAVESPGFYSGVSRMIMRSGVTLVDQMKGIFKSPNVVSGIKNLVGFFDVIRQSKFMAALNAFSSIGEIALKTKKDAEQYKVMGEDRYSSVDYAPNGLSSVTKGRLQRNDDASQQTIKLAWSSNRAISLLSTPNVLRSTLTKAVIDEGPAALLQAPGDLSRTVYVRNDGNRLSSDAVDYVESVLDSEYVPFYFHDLRTNEIISFHAFIASITDDYAPSWESMEAPGRIDPVRIYKNTIRKIGLSFYIVSTSEVDFDEMWIKINKLITLVYPQYTMGSVVQDSMSDPKYRFVVPFSQLPSASPLVRIRLGDLFRSNYSKFALARLFGMGSQYVEQAGDDKLMVDGSTFLVGKPSDEDEKKLSMLTEKVGHESELSSVTFLVSTANIRVDDIVLDNESSEDRASASSLLESLKKKGTRLAVQLKNPSFSLGRKDCVGVKLTTTRAEKYLSDSEMIDNSSVNDLVSFIYVSPSSINVPKEEAKRFLLGDASSTTVNQKFATFMDEKENALVRSFKQTGGKGLAGAIDSLNFDWYDNVTWETETIGSKAPKMCKVSLSFSPIHDISPGIDHNGYNRAPLYPVGSSDGSSFNIGSKSPLTKKLLVDALKSSAAASSGLNSRKT